MIKITPLTFTTLFRHNLTIKLLSLILAISLWGFGVISRESTHDMVLPIELQNIPSGYSPRNLNQNLVQFSVTGPALHIKSAKVSNSSLMLDLKNTTAGKTQFNNLEKHLKLDPSVRVTRIYPAAIEIELLDTQINPTQGERHK